MTNFENILYVIEATDYERFSLWEDWAKQSAVSKSDRTLLNWGGNSSSRMVRVGVVDGRPINIQVTVEIINGAKIIFYEGISQLVDYKMIRAWVDENLLTEIDGRPNHSNAMNFHHCIQVINKYSCETIAQ